MLKPGISRVPSESPEGYMLCSREFREPKKGEYCISGAIPFAYLALNDLSTKYWIAIPIHPPPKETIFGGFVYTLKGVAP